MSASLTLPELAVEAPPREAAAGRPARRARLMLVIAAAAIIATGAFATTRAEASGSDAVRAQSEIMAMWLPGAPALFTAVSLLLACCSKGNMSLAVGLVSKGVTLLVELYVCYAVWNDTNAGWDTWCLMTVAISLTAVKIAEVANPVAGTIVDCLLGADVAFLISLMDGTRDSLPAFVTNALGIRTVALCALFSWLCFGGFINNCTGAPRGNWWEDDGRPASSYFEKSNVMMCLGCTGVPAGLASLYAWWYLLEADWKSAAATGLVVIEATGLVQDVILIVLEFVLEVAALRGE